MKRSPPRHGRSWIYVTLLISLSPGAPATDCNSNGISDPDDIASGTSRDCNRDLIPDECDLQAVNFGLEVVANLVPKPWTGATAAAALDFDGDGDLDLATALSSTEAVTLLENLGGLRFEPPTKVPATIKVGQTTLAIIPADLNGDGSTDLATMNYMSNDISVLLNDRHGALSGLAYPVSTFPRSMAVADLEADGDLDLVVASEIHPDSVEALRNSGLGAFGQPERVDVPAGARSSFPSVTLGDLDGDQRPDLVFSSGDQKIEVLKNAGDGTFTEVLADSLTGVTAAIADLDGDGAPDLITNGIAVYMNPGNGRFAQPIYLKPVDEGLVNRPAIADLDADGKLDALVRLRAVLNLGGGKFSISTALPVVGEPLVANLDGAGVLEVLDPMDLKTYRERPIAYSLDCNGNGIPDECDLKTTSRDCNLNNIPDECDLAEGLSHDCNENGILDICENDCNRNGIEDSCDIAAGIGEDLDHDGRIDHCDPVFTYGFDAPATVQGMPGETRTFDVYLTLATDNNFTGEGAQSWSVSLFADGGTVRAITVKGIVVDTIYDDLNGVHHDPYPFDLADSFTRIANLGQHWQDPSKKGAISAVVMKSLEHMALQPRLTQRIARLSVEATIPAGGDCARVSIHYENGGRSTVSGPVYNVVTLKGRSYPPVLGSTTVLICPTQFRRGDANSDRLVDISDPIFTLSYLFLGGLSPACLESGNANDDALLDLSDPVYLLESLFLGGGLGRIAAPGAYACGTGGAFRGLPCDDSPCPLEPSAGL
jgi:VCBS repeat protein